MRRRALLAVLLLLVFAACLSPARRKGETGSSSAPAPSTTAMTPAVRVSPSKKVPGPAYRVTRAAAPVGANAAWEARNPAQAFSARFARDGVVLSPLEGGRDRSRWAWSMRLSSIGRRAGARQVVADVEPAASGARVDYKREAGWAEWYLNTPDGLEQGFTVRARPEGAGELRIELAWAGGLVAQQFGDQIEFRGVVSAPGLAYGKLSARDARGRSLAAKMALEADRVVLSVDDTRAVYPVEIDPLTWATPAELIPADAASGDTAGSSVALSGDTALVGAPAKDGSTGAAYVFVRTGDAWTEQAKLTASDAAANDRFGGSVAIDGDTAVVGAVGKNSSAGAAYVLVRVAGVWTQQAKLTASDAAASDSFGSVSVAGDTVVVGARGKDGNTGAAYVFVRAAGVWTQQAKLTASDAAAGVGFGASVSVSGDTTMAGAPGPSAGTGAAYVFIRAGNNWTQQAKLVGSGASSDWRVGAAVAVELDTAVIGAPGYFETYRSSFWAGASGAAYVFGRPGSAWSERAKIAPIGWAVGRAVAISGGLVLVGAAENATCTDIYGYSFDCPGAPIVYLFESLGGWSERDRIAQDQIAGSSWSFASALSLSGDTALVGDPFANGAGTTFVFAFRYLSAGSPCTLDQQCASGWCDASVCRDPAPTGSACAADRQCASGWCDASVCRDPAPDGTACTADAHCASRFCYLGFCRAKFLLGTACIASAQCASGACADGVCCTSACTGQCEACDIAGSVGTCSPVKSGQPHGARLPCAGTNVGKKCGPECRGLDRKACAHAPAKILCQAATCGGAPPVQTKPSACDGAGHCCDATGDCQDVPTACEPYQCGAIACKSWCTSTAADCQPGYECINQVCARPSAPPKLGDQCSRTSACPAGTFCTNGVCCGVAACPGGSACNVTGHRGSCTKLPGTGCTSAAECGSGLCVDGVCCATACDGQCQACDVKGFVGQCTAVSGDPHGARAKCDDGGGDPCKARTCDGATDPMTCTRFKNGSLVVCAAPSCAYSSFTAPSTCDGAGGCKAPAPSRCDPFACDANGCKFACARQDECAPGFLCNAGTCVQGARCSDDGLASYPKEGGEPTSCAPFRCTASGKCATDCATADDCAPGFACRAATQTCESSTASTSTSSAGGCHASPADAGSAGGSGAFWLLGLGLARTARRRWRRSLPPTARR